MSKMYHERIRFAEFDISVCYHIDKPESIAFIINIGNFSVALSVCCRIEKPSTTEKLPTFIIKPCTGIYKYDNIKKYPMQGTQYAHGALPIQMVYWHTLLTPSPSVLQIQKNCRSSPG
jgi:hypothetical protein